ncbi:sugar transferase [Limosilactobacillus agrestis]|uniref:sugar transferase n=1 Tax=Limosilactobacillus agrestis TaxID=2759748 RepID=UPI001E3CAD19|nr:sugar transferase [Limosilactobacillus agrestis]MCD7120612.1 sugar transferase [Limosilactobacillus agrestis]
MTVHITNLYGLGGTAKVAQQMVAKIGCQDLGMNELGIYVYQWGEEPLQERNARFDGIVASLAYGDTVIIQSPSWNSIEWDQAFIDHLNNYVGIKKIIFIHDVAPLMFESNRCLLPQFIKYYNQADVLIVPSIKMYRFLCQNGLEEKPYVVQHFWDHLVNNLDYSITPKNKKVINFAGNFEGITKKFDFVKNWQNSNIKLQVFYDPQQSYPEQNLEVTGWKNDPILLDTLRRTGGFGLLWSEDPYWSEYIKINASFKTGTYLASGIPLIVSSDMPEKDTIKRKNIGIVVDSLEEAQEKVLQISNDEYNQMVKNVDSFAKLIREGYFTKKALTEAVFKVRYE